MPTATLRAVGGSVVTAIPEGMPEMVYLRAGSKMHINPSQRRLIVVPQKKKSYKLSELLAQCNPALPLNADEQEWVGSPGAGPEENKPGK